MTCLRFAFATLIVCLLGCNVNSEPKATKTQVKAILKVNAPATSDTTKDKQEIQKLI